MREPGHFVVEQPGPSSRTSASRHLEASRATCIGYDEMPPQSQRV